MELNFRRPTPSTRLRARLISDAALARAFSYKAAGAVLGELVVERGPAFPLLVIGRGRGFAAVIRGRDAGFGVAL